MNKLIALFVGVLTLLSTSPVQIITPQSKTPPSSAKAAPATNASMSRNWSGYVAQDATYTGVQGTWTIPQIAPQNSTQADATWIGVGGSETTDLIQAGIETFVGRNGQVMYSAFYETLPDASTPLNIDVAAGDSISASVMQTKTGQWNVKIINNTNRQQAQVNVAYDSSLSSAEWIEEAPSTTRRIMPLDNFGSIQFTSAKAMKDGQTTTLAETNAEPIAMGSSVSGPLATASIIGDDEASFSINRVNPDQQAQRDTPDSSVFPYRRLKDFGFGKAYEFLFHK